MFVFDAENALLACVENIFLIFANVAFDAIIATSKRMQGASEILSQI